jgi:hypothetical protein
MQQKESLIGNVYIADDDQSQKKTQDIGTQRNFSDREVFRNG